MKSVEELLVLKRKAQDHLIRHQNLLEEIQEQCWHPEEQIQHKSLYHEGGYDYKAETVYWDECLICGEKMNSKTKTHSWYG